MEVWRRSLKAAAQINLRCGNYSRMMMVVIIIMNFEVYSDIDEINAPDHA